MAKKIEDQVIKLLKDNNMTLGYEFDFPMYKILPDEVRLAMSVLNNHGMKVLVTLKNIDKLDKK